MSMLRSVIVGVLCLAACLQSSRVATAQAVGNPFQRQVPAPEFPEGMEWLNTDGPLKLADLRGKFVLLDFWTYCCINCMHVLPELKKLEKQFDKQLVVIGVHSAKFENERDVKNISDAILRYEIEHPVVNDRDHTLWTQYGVRSWPSTLLIDPEGNVVYGRSGEFLAEDYAKILQVAIAWYRKKGTLVESKVSFPLLADKQPDTPLRFPGKVLADEASGRLFIADSNHNRIVVTSLDGQVQKVIGSGQVGSDNGNFANASFNHPQGMALVGNRLYVADTENHMIREVDLAAEKVRRVAGTGVQSKVAFPGYDPRSPGRPRRGWAGPAKRTAIASPWALWSHGGDLFIAMAGPHQIWRWDPQSDRIGPYAGNGREDIVDGALLPNEAYAEGSSSFAQPSGLTSDGKWLYVADSEGSSIRAVPLPQQSRQKDVRSVQTVVGTADLPQARLFTFGDVEGSFGKAKFQHALGVSYHDAKIYVADTYNNRIKLIDLNAAEVRNLAGDGKAGTSDDPARFDEPGGLSYAAGRVFVADTNNHSIRVIDTKTGAVSTLKLRGLPPKEFR